MTGIDRPGAVPLRESASLLEHQKAPCQLDHAAANSGVAGSGKSFLPPLRAALVGCSRQTGVTCHRPSISQIARENLTYEHIRRFDPDAARVTSGERGCPLANAAVELPDKDHPARRVIEAFKTAQRERLIQLCAAAALEEPELLADELFLLLEGARVTAQSMGPRGTR